MLLLLLPILLLVVVYWNADVTECELFDSNSFSIAIVRSFVVVVVVAGLLEDAEGPVSVSSTEEDLAALYVSQLLRSVDFVIVVSAPSPSSLQNDLLFGNLGIESPPVCFHCSRNCQAASFFFLPLLPFWDCCCAFEDCDGSSGSGIDDCSVVDDAWYGSFVRFLL